MTELDERLNTIADTAAVDMCGEIEDDQKVILKAIYLGIRAFAEQEPTEKMLQQAYSEIAQHGLSKSDVDVVAVYKAMMAEALKALD